MAAPVSWRSSSATCCNASTPDKLRDGPAARRLRLVPDSAGRLAKLLRITGLTDVFELHSSLAGALAPSGACNACNVQRGES
ncbi:hypothetical protein O1L68_41720 [Streptomyces lydicus]|nr:hypothetical protein [Streptomyces lydicus]MCZ1012229.1 hypothetical protein [Streptomyces lydicus]